MKLLILPSTALVCFLILGLASAKAQFVDFNGSNPSAQFNQTASETFGTGYWLIDSGILDQPGPVAGGSVNAYNTSPTYVYNTPLTNSGVAALTISGTVKGDFASAGSGVTALGLGFMNSQWTDFRGVTSYIALKLIGNGTNLTWFTSQWGGNFDQGSSVTLNPANWYRITVTFTKGATIGLWNWSATIADYGTSGTAFVSMVNTASGSFTHSSTYNAASLYGAINFSATLVNSTQLDNFTEAGGTAYEAWRLLYFTVPQLTNPSLEASVWGDGADPDADGRSNLIEYSTGTSPLFANPGTATTLGTSLSNQMTLGFARIGDPSLTYTVRGANDLTAMSAGTPIFSSTGTNNTPATITAQDTVTIGSQPGRFLRLEVSR
jgi:hypothetical protein